MQTFDFTAGSNDINRNIDYDIFTCFRCRENNFMIGSPGSSPQPLTNSTTGVTIIPPSGGDVWYIVLMPVPRLVLSNTGATFINCRTNGNLEQHQFEDLSRFTCLLSYHCLIWYF